MIAELRDLRLGASRVRALLARRDRREPRLNALQVRKNAVVDAIGAAVLGLEGANVSTLRAIPIGGLFF